MSLLGNLRVRLTAETEDFRRGLDGARRQLTTFSQDVDRFRKSTLANVATVGAFGAALRSSISVANEYDRAQAQLAATAKLTGVQFDFLQGVAAQAQERFRLSAVQANGLTIELSKLASKAGDVGQASAGLEAFLDIGAARGLDAQQTLNAVRQSILGIDEGTDKLFGKNPSAIYAEFATQIGTTAARLTDQQKAQALLNAAMQDGAVVRGEYSKWLQSAQGQQFLLSQSIEQTQAALGKALQPALVSLLPVLSKLAEWVQLSIQGWQMLGATLSLIPALVSAAKAGITGGLDAAKREMRHALEAWREMIAEIQAGSSVAAHVPTLLPTPSSSPTTSPAPATTVEQFGGLQEEWERLRHAVALRSISLIGNEEQRLALEEQHALRLLAIEEERLRVRRQSGELSEAELANGLAEIAERREIAQARREEFVALEKSLRAQQHWLDLADAVGDLFPSLPSGPGAAIGRSAGNILADQFEDFAALGGGLMGSLVLPGIGSLLGGAVGSLFGRDQQEQRKQTAALERIDGNTRQAAHILELNRQMVDAARGYFNVPAGFVLPQYSPSVSVTVTNHVQVQDNETASVVVETMRTELGPMLQQEFAKVGLSLRGMA